MPIIDVTENHKQSITESNINDLTKTFRDRYTKLREILENEQNITGNLYSVSEIINKADTHKETKRTPKLNKYQITNILTKNKQYLKNITSGRYTFKNIYENKVILYDTRQKKDVIIDSYQRENLPTLMKFYTLIQKAHSLKTITLLRHVKRTKKGNYILTCEDGTKTDNKYGYGKIDYIRTFLTPETLKESGITPDTLVPDTVVYQEIKFIDYPILGTQLQRDKLKTIDIKQPSLQRKQTHLTKDAHIVFLSDIHVGSKYFNETKLLNTIDYINKSEVDAVLIAGDIVDGIGIYPEQEKDLAINSFHKQYEKLSEYLDQIEPHMYITPGNHDAVPLKEPQQPLTKQYAPNLCKNKNITLLSNPSTVNINGTRIKMYHGKGLDDLIMAIKNLDYQHPCKVMEEQLEKRHLAPIYGMTTQHAWDGEDRLIIDELPDILHTGHVHIAQHTNYKGIELINSGTFQEQTPFQTTHKIRPTVGLVPVLKDGKITMKQM